MTLYLYIHRVRDCEPGVYRWDSRQPQTRATPSRQCRARGGLPQSRTSAGGQCLFRRFDDRGLAKVARGSATAATATCYFDAGAIGQRLYVGAEALGWNATGIGAFYDDDVHRYLGFLAEDTVNSVSDSVAAAEQAALVMLGSPASRHAAAQTAKGKDSRGRSSVVTPSRIDTAGTRSTHRLQPTPRAGDLSFRRRSCPPRSPARGLKRHGRHSGAGE